MKKIRFYQGKIIITIFFATLSLFLSCSDSPYQPKSIRMFKEGNELFKQKKYKEALEYYNQSIEIDTNFLESYHNRGLAHFHLGNYDLAIQDYNLVLQKNPSYLTAFMSRSQVFYVKKNYNLAIQDISSAISLKPDSAVLYLQRAKIYTETNNFAQAIKDIDQLLEITPNDSEAWGSRGYLHYRLQTTEKAIQDLQKAIQLNPKQDLAYTNLGLAYGDAEDFTKALQYLNQAVNQNPSETYNLDGRAWIFLMKGDVQNAKKDIAQSLKWDSENAWALRNQLLLFVYEKQLKDAESLLKRIETLPNADQVAFMEFVKGEYFWATEQPEKACECWQNAQEKQAKKRLKAHCNSF